jgi:hypothetical protein
MGAKIAVAMVVAAFGMKYKIDNTHSGQVAMFKALLGFVTTPDIHCVQSPVTFVNESSFK